MHQGKLDFLQSLNWPTSIFIVLRGEVRNTEGSDKIPTV